MLATLASALLLLTGAGQIFSGSHSIYDGDDLYSLCVTGPEYRTPNAEKECLGYILGVVDSHLLAAAGLGVSPMPGRPRCPAFAQAASD